MMAEGGGAAVDKAGLSCKFCGTTDNLLRCSRCKLAYYCSRDHQNRHWRIHKVECRPSTQPLPNQPSPASPRSSSNTIPQSRNNNNNQNDIPGIPVSNGLVLVQQQEDNNKVPTPAPTSSTVPTPTTALTTPSSSSSSSQPLNVNNPAGLIVNDTSLDGTNGGGSQFNIVRPKMKMHSRHAESILTNTQRMERTCKQIVYDLTTQGICQFDQFLGPELGSSVLDEVRELYESGVFRDGQLVNSRAQNASGKIRGDKIAWIGEIDDRCRHIGDLIGIVDALVTRCNKMPDNGEFGRYELKGRTKAMVACYPGDGAQYVKHVDNPNNDGRCITCIYYLNKNWNEAHGGCLIISPTGKDCDAIIKPEFDRIVFFWSDRRNPHQVQKSYETRYAITIWYLDKGEREKAQLRDMAR